MNTETSGSNSPSWQSTLVALGLIALVGGIFIVVFEKSGTDDALKVWGGLGTLVGVLVGAIPTYFFGQQTTAAAQRETQRVHEAATSETKRWREALEKEQDNAATALKAQGESKSAVRKAEAKADALLPHVSPAKIEELKAARPELFG